VWQTKLASCLVNFWAHNKIVSDDDIKYVGLTTCFTKVCSLLVCLFAGTLLLVMTSLCVGSGTVEYAHVISWPSVVKGSRFRIVVVVCCVALSCVFSLCC